MKEQLAVRDIDVTPLFYRAAAAARKTGEPHLVSVSAPAPTLDPIDVFDLARSQTERAMLWQLPDQGVALVGIGLEAEFVGRGPDRFAHVADQWQLLVQRAHIGETGGGAGAMAEKRTPGQPEPGPIALGGFAFTADGASGPWTGFGDGRLFLPRVAYGVGRGGRWFTFNAVVTGGADIDGAVAAMERDKRWWTAAAAQAIAQGRREPDGVDARGTRSLAAQDLPAKEQWLRAVARVAADIRAGKLEKAVLARSERIPLPDDFSIARALRRLRADYPETYVFAVAHAEGCFVGATPERIVHVADGRVNVACMAGSIGRGATPAEDARLGETLLKDSKNVEEHKVVLRAILHALAPVCDDVTAPEEPGLRKFANVQHLYTPVQGRARPGVDVLELVSRVHPTPAIGGHPTGAALQLIAQEEQLDRGWYAGPVGWMNARGEGEFAVGLRSGLIKPGEARLFAGCGIMGDSDPESEYAESVLKLRPMRRALEAGVG